MKGKIITLIILLIIIQSIITQVQSIQNNNQSYITQYDNGYRYNIQGWVYLHLKGDPYERGYQYGYLASKEIINMMQRWGNFAHDLQLPRLIFMKNGNYDELSKQWWNICRIKSINIFLPQVPDEFVQEMRGLTDGLNDKGVTFFNREIEFEDVVASQFVQEVIYIIKYKFKHFHPIRNLINGIKDILTGQIINYDGHCNAFIATGDATKDGGIIATHATIFPKYISERCNFIVDMEPTNGYRFIMTCPPGSLWSQEDWYQNEKGIILTETETTPQGPWMTRGTIPKSVRSRTAIQYSDSINEIIHHLMKKNNGLIPNEWLIGDRKTGEIASLQQVLYNNQIKRSYNDYYFSNCLVHNIKILQEITGVPIVILKMIPIIFPNKCPYSIKEDQVIWKEDVYQQLKDLGEKYYGDIDEFVAKQILSSEPIYEHTTDGKITSSSLMKNLGLIAQIGCVNGNTIYPTNSEKINHKYVTELPCNGWVKIFTKNTQKIRIPKNKDQYESHISYSDNQVKWIVDTNSEKNCDYAYCIQNNNHVISGSSNGYIYSLSKSDGNIKWKTRIGNNTIKPVIHQNSIIGGSDEGIYRIDYETGIIKWQEHVGIVTSSPQVYKNLLLVGCADGLLLALDALNGEIQWKQIFEDDIYISNIVDDFIVISSGSACYGFDIQQRTVKWKYNTTNTVLSSATIYRNKIFFGSWDGIIYALNGLSRELLWRFQSGWGICTTPVISNNVLYVGSNDNFFYALNCSTGSIIWRYQCFSGFHSNPVCRGDFVFTGCDDGRLYIFNANNGKLESSFIPGYFLDPDTINNYLSTPFLADPLVVDKMIYVGVNGRIYALYAKTIESYEKVLSNSDLSSPIPLPNIFSFLILFLITSVTYKKLK